MKRPHMSHAFGISPHPINEIHNNEDSLPEIASGRSDLPNICTCMYKNQVMNLFIQSDSLILGGLYEDLLIEQALMRNMKTTGGLTQGMGYT